jgi:hypothetical protein
MLVALARSDITLPFWMGQLTSSFHKPGRRDMLLLFFLA